LFGWIFPECPNVQELFLAWWLLFCLPGSSASVFSVKKGFDFFCGDLCQEQTSEEKAGLLEKSAWLIIIVISFLLFVSLTPKAVYWGNIFSGGWIPWLNILITVKVGSGTWALSPWFA